MTLDELIESLKTGKVYRTPVFTMTIPEGLTFSRLLQLWKNGQEFLQQEFLDYVNNEQTIADLMARYPNMLTEEILAEDVRYPLEGYLFPATYPFYEEKPSVETVVDDDVGCNSRQYNPLFRLFRKRRESRSIGCLLSPACLKGKRLQQRIVKRLPVSFITG